MRVLARDLAQLEHIQCEAMLAWKKSQGVERRLRKRVLPGNPPRWSR